MSADTTAAPTAAPTVALLGTGIMGAGMARNVAAAGMPLRVWNRSRDKAEPLADVADVCGSVAEAVDGADLVVTTLFDGDSVAEVMKEAAGAVGEGAVWVQSTTVGVDAAERFVDVAADLGLAYVDAPVLGTRKPAEDGTLVVLASGPESAREPVAPLFDAIGGRTLWVGEAGAGSRLKLAANAWVFTVVEGIAESLTLTRELGLDPALFLDVVKGGALDAPYVQLKGSAMLDDELTPSFGLANALKDVELILDAAGDAGVDLGLMPGIREHFARAVDDGHGDLDLAATYRSH